MKINNLTFRSFAFFLAIVNLSAGTPAQPPRKDAHTLALFHFDKDEGTAITDDTANATGTLGSEAKWIAQGRFGGGVEFDECDSDARKDPSLVKLPSGLFNGETFTIDFWFKVTGTMSLGKRDFYFLSNPDLYFRWSVDRQSVEFGLQLPEAQAPGGWAGCASPKRQAKVRPDTWHHLAGTYDGSELRLYLDGEKVGGATGKGAIRAKDRLLLGCCSWDANADKSALLGEIDELRISDIVKTEFGLTVP